METEADKLEILKLKKRQMLSSLGVSFPSMSQSWGERRKPPRNTNGSKQNWSPKACYLEPKMMERAVAPYHSLTPVKHNRKTNPHIQCRHHTGGRTQPNPPAHTGVPSEKAQWKSALPPLPSQGMVSTEAWGGGCHTPALIQQ